MHIRPATRTDLEDVLRIYEGAPASGAPAIPRVKRSRPILPGTDAMYVRRRAACTRPSSLFRERTRPTA